jgi:hypothetical protein
LATNGIPPYNYEWKNKNNQILSTQNAYTICLDSTASFTLKVSDSKGCSNKKSVKIKAEYQYQIGNITKLCGSAGNKICVPLIAIDSVPNGVIGMDFCLNYDKTMMTPSGIVNLGPVVLRNIPANMGSYYVFNDVANSRFRISVFYTTQAPQGTVFTGKGEVLCVEFNLNNAITPVYNYLFTTCELSESYELHEEDKCARPGKFSFVSDSVLTGRLLYRNITTKPLGYDSLNPTAHLISKIYGADSVNCISGTNYTYPFNLNGQFKYHAQNGNSVKIVRDIPGSNTRYDTTCTDVMRIINGMDCYYVGRITTLDPGFSPNVFQILAADVNLNGKVRANDITLIQQRVVKTICEFPQVWNYTLGSDPNKYPSAGKTSKDWLFITAKEMTLADYKTKTALNVNGYWRDKVPTTPNCLPLKKSLDKCKNVVANDYYGVLLGDVFDGIDTRTPTPNSIGYPSNGGMANIRTEAALSVLTIDLKNMKNMGNEVYRVPVNYSSIDTTRAIDFSLLYDKKKVNIKQIYAHEVMSSNNLNMLWNNFRERELLVSSYSMDELPRNSSAFFIEMTTPTGKIPAKEDFAKDNLVLINGVEARLEITPAPVDAEGKPLVVLPESIEFNIYPSPGKGLISLDFLTTNSGDNKIQIYDVLGRIIEEHTGLPAKGIRLFNTSRYSSGVYIAILSGEGVKITKKFVVR